MMGRSDQWNDQSKAIERYDVSGQESWEETRKHCWTGRLKARPITTTQMQSKGKTVFNPKAEDARNDWVTQSGTNHRPHQASSRIDIETIMAEEIRWSADDNGQLTSVTDWKCSAATLGTLAQCISHWTMEAKGQGVQQ